MNPTRRTAVVELTRCRTCGDCLPACPLGQDISGYIALIEQNDIDAAAAMIRRTAALPGVLGRLCPSPCAAVCRMGATGRKVPDIRGLKRFVVSRSRAQSIPLPEVPLRFCVVGAGPAGLSAAHCLRQAGASVEVYEARSSAGGLLACAVPAFVLPLPVLAADVDILVQSGIVLHLNTRVGTDVSLDALLQQYDGVIAATGPGTDPDESEPESKDPSHAQWAFRFRSMHPRVRARILVMGADVRALSCARIAVRLDATRVIMVHPLPLAFWPIGKAGAELAQREGIELLDCHAPDFSMRENGRSVVWMQKMQAQTVDWLGMPQMIPTADGHWMDADIRIHEDAFVSPGLQDDRLVTAGEALGLPLCALAAMAQGRAAAARMLVSSGICLLEPPCV